MTTVILYRYKESPFSHKIDHVLQLKNIPHYTLAVPPMPPRTDIQALGLSYRRIPILLCDRDIYCDTRLISTALESRFPDGRGYPSIFPSRKNASQPDEPLISVLSSHYESVLFPLFANLLAWEHFPPAFLEDRSKFIGAELNPKALVAARPVTISKFLLHLQSIEAQFQDGRDWIFDTVSPSLADISIYFIFNGVKSFKYLHPENLFSSSQFPRLAEWAARMAQCLERSPSTATPIAGDGAFQLISESTAPLKPQPTATDFNDEEGKRLGIRFGDTVFIAPEDAGRDHPTSGRLIALNNMESVIEIGGKAGLFRCHFPRLGFGIKSLSPKL